MTVKRGGWDARDNVPEGLAAVLCLRGAGTYTDERGRDWPLAPGRMFLRRTGRRHSVRIADEGPWTECWIVLSAPFETAWTAAGILPVDQPVLEVGVDLALVRELRSAAEALASADEHDLPHHLVRLQGILVSLLGRAASGHGQRFDLDRACRLLADDPRADLRRVAHELGMGWERFRKVFRERAGISPGAYRLRRRLERAQAELLSSDQPIHALAASLGYLNPFTFSTLFRRHVGCSPAEWRRGRRPA